jgi:DNA polymerase-4
LQERTTRAETAPMRWARAVAHFDLDAFFAAIEQLERPELRGLPVVVGGDPGGRGVVSTASYEARVFGIHSAMPARQARQLCPDAVFVTPRTDLYRAYSQRVFAIAHDCSPVVEQAGIDEGYLDLSAALEPLALARTLKARVRAEVGLTVSVGLAANKLVAKIASDLQKPDGLTVVAQGDEAATLAALPVRRLPGVGPRTASWLADAGVYTIGALATLDVGYLGQRLGSASAIRRP